LPHYFITGIGTDVGKTIASSILVEALEADYWKPIQSGATLDSDTLMVRSLISNKKTIFHSESYCFDAPLSPHEAADIENIEIKLNDIKLPETKSTLIIEGAGGIMVPLNKKHTFIDLIKKFNIPVILVIKHYLGAINHSLLSIDVLTNNNIKIAGLIYNGTDDYGNEAIINEKSNIPVFGKIAYEETINNKVIKKYSQKFKRNLMS
jgi:dethiobiotin synthetase